MPVVIIGAGLGGLTVALNLAEQGQKVVVLAKRDLGEAATAWAQGCLGLTVYTLPLSNTKSAGCCRTVGRLTGALKACWNITSAATPDSAAATAWVATQVGLETLLSLR